MIKTSRLILATVLVVILSATATACRADKKQADTTPAMRIEPREQHLSIIFAGDLMQHAGQIKTAQRADGTYNYDECFAAISPEIERADVAIGNFEVTLGGKPYQGYPQFRAPDEFLQASIDAGFDILLTANNHCLDSRRRGLERTIHVMDSLGVPHLGTYIDKEEREKTYPFLLEKNGLRVVLLNFTYGTNGLLIEAPNVVNLIDTAQIRADIAKAKTMQPDVIIAMPHWGIEYQTLPSAEQRRVSDWLIAQGVDHVIGGHPHVAQPMELSADSAHLVAWSMGNLISNMTKTNTYGGYMVRMDLVKRDTIQYYFRSDGTPVDTTSYGARTRLSDCGYLLYYVSRPAENGNKHNFRVLPIDIPDDQLTGIEQKNRYAIRSSMRRLMERHGKGVREWKFGEE